MFQFIQYANVTCHFALQSAYVLGPGKLLPKKCTRNYKRCCLIFLQVLPTDRQTRTDILFDFIIMIVLIGIFAPFILFSQLITPCSQINGTCYGSYMKTFLFITLTTLLLFGAHG